MAGNETVRDARPGEGRVFFDAVLHPHRSLSPRGFRILMVFSALGLFVVGLLFFSLGAWPVIGFCGLELLLLYAGFRISYRDGRAAERIRLSDAGLEISRLEPDGAVAAHWNLAPNWLRVDIGRQPDYDGQLILSTHGRRFLVGRFLTPEERLEVAAALRDALDRWRTAPHPCAAA